MSLENLTSGKPLLQKIPEHEAEFIVGQANQILGRLKSNSLEGLLSEVVNVFSEKEYGWEESILDGLWYRYPSEIRTMRFCSEEALKNYLLLRVLGIPARYAIVEGYDNRGVAHEVVIVRDGRKTYVVDWDVSKVRVTDNGFKPVGGKLVPFGRIAYLSEDEVLDRVIALRSGKSFLDAIESGQMLYRKMYPEGELSGFVQYYPQTHEIHFLFTLNRLLSGLRYYHLDKMKLNGGSIEHEDEEGVVISGSDFNVQKIPVFPISRSSVTVPQLIGELEKSFENVDDIVRLNLALEFLYETNLKIQEGGAQPFFSKKEIRDKIFEESTSSRVWKNSSRRWKTVLSHYDSLKRESPALAERFFDYRLFYSKMLIDFKDLKGIQNYLGDDPISSSVGVHAFIFNLANCREIGKIFLQPSTYDAQKRLCEALAEKIGIPVPTYMPSATLSQLPLKAVELLTISQKIWTDNA